MYENNLGLEQNFSLAVISGSHVFHTDGDQARNISSSIANVIHIIDAAGGNNSLRENIPNILGH